VETRADGHGIVRIDGARVEFDVLDFSFLVNHEGGPPRPFEFIHLHVVLLEDPVLRQDFPVHVAEQREGDADLLGKGVVRGGTIDADSENNRVAFIELGQIRLIGL